MATYKTPGVYVEELSLLPPSVAQVETAVPAFIGYTERASLNGKDLELVPTKITSLAEFVEAFGGAPEIKVDAIELDQNNNVKSATLADGFLLYDSIRLFYANGGSKCYIVSLGRYPDSTEDVDAVAFEDALLAIEKEDEPTLLVFPDAVLLSDDKLYGIQQAALEQCAKLGDRFAILDLYPTSETLPTFEDTVEDFRDKIGIRNLKYGAAYAPYLRTNLSKNITYRQIRNQITRAGAAVDVRGLTSDAETVASIQVLENALGDVDRFQSLFNEGDPDVDGPTKLEEDYLITLNALQAQLNDGTASSAARYAAYKAVLTELYDIVSTLDEAATNAEATLGAGTGQTPFSFHSPTGNERKTRYVLDDLRASIELGGVLHSATLVLSGLIQHSGRVQPAGIEDEDTIAEDIDLSTLTADWGSFAESGSAADYYPTDLGALTGDELDQAIAGNIAAGAQLASAAHKALVAEVRKLAAAAKEYERTYEAALIATFPLLKTIIARSKNAITELPPSGAIAGVYASVDATRGVHKAPANVSLNSVVGVSALINHDEQQDLNVDVVAGKSINAIRPFTGKGVLVWGARTLAGNDNEWRYVSVRRFFNMVEESTKKATEHFVFEPNDASTWVKVKTMIENFLLNQWRAGALAGAKPEDAFYVKVGLGRTMTAQDVLEGRMIVEIGLAAVRPAEFIVLRFAHKMQES